MSTSPQLSSPAPTPAEQPTPPQAYGLFTGLVLAGGILIASFIITGTWTRVADSNTVTVTGSSSRNVHSDLAVWRVGFSEEGDTLLEAQKKLGADLSKVEGFLQASGMRDFVVMPVQVREITDNVDHEKDAVPLRIGYRANQAIEVRSSDVDTVAKLASESTELVEQGVVFVSEGLDFVYSKANDVKIEMTGEALQNAHAHAEQIAEQGGRKLKDLRSARMGPIQVAPLYTGLGATEGPNDISARDKTITVTITATYGLR